MFSDLEGRLHMLDYDKKFLLKSHDNLTFDGSSIRGFTAQKESDLRLFVDWSAFYWAPSDVFGSGKVLVFGEVIDKDGSPFAADMRGILKKFSNDKFEKDGYTLNAANEIEGFVFDGLDAEQRYHETRQFRVRQHRRLLPLAARRSAAQVHRHRRRSAARDGLRKRKGPPRSRALAVRDQLQLR